ncbi:MAG: class I SAM-dependent methyltransferase [Comamonadaceae bacterium]|nr:class I SAM-dependent methyltransferase [Rubrivivax sp.]NLZ40416.1 class I SAM-dependent methyltransferase [Comamonadaceae bacterium]
MNKPMRLRSLLAATLLAAAAPFAAAAEAVPAPLSAEQIAAIVASPERSDADRTNDRRRKPEQMLAFIGVRPGMAALDIVAAGGYTSELLARAVGPTGRVYAQGSAPPRPALAARIAKAQPGNLVAAVRPFDDPAPPEAAGGLDLVTLMFNYHDLVGMGADRERMNRAVFAALKPGGLYVIADHSAQPGSGAAAAKTLHRIDEALVRAEVERAGFRLAAEGGFLRNPADPRERETPEPPMPKDEFVLKFVKP